MKLSRSLSALCEPPPPCARSRASYVRTLPLLTLPFQALRAEGEDGHDQASTDLERMRVGVGDGALARQRRPAGGGLIAPTGIEAGVPACAISTVRLISLLVPHAAAVTHIGASRSGAGATIGITRFVVGRISHRAVR